MPNETLTNTELAVIADEDTAMGFKALGFKAYIMKDKEELAEILEAVVNDGVGICLVEEGIYKKAEVALQTFNTRPAPVFIPFSKDGKVEKINTILKGMRLRATGTI